MKDKRILTKIISNRQEIKIIAIYVLLFFGIGAMGYIYSIFKYYQFIYQGPEKTVLPIPNVDFLLWNSDSSSFELSFYRFHDIQQARKFVQIYLHFKLKSKITSQKQIFVRSQISIMRSGWHRGYAGSVLQNEKINVELTCAEICKPQMVFEYKIPEYNADYMLAIEILNPAELYNEGVEAFTTGAVTERPAFALQVFLFQVTMYIISIIAFISALLSLENARDPSYLRIFSLCGIYVNSQWYLFYPGRIRILIKEVILSFHIALLINLWFKRIENLTGKKYNKIKMLMITLIAIPSFLVFHLLWNLPLILGISVFGIWTLFTIIFNYKKFKQLSWCDLIFFLAVSTYLICYLYILTMCNYDFMANSQMNLLFNLKNAIFTMIIVCIDSLSRDIILKSLEAFNAEKDEIVDLTISNRSMIES